ncbi:hypothetical protein BDY17DRAFT_190889 [Neohortaea acidophila]|uniref:Uncharacterized protein n=1 Tax=Neohortaea acidophila TaxID=245834 RepID=A0A6A6PN91_9PEZI|nr:uncharacterized protein BDY17DRAFT_190889 [Neohortaea acidophila]KAF2481570.1 hypothetical protein BDY17DRAFT_190889 [Neohortaea acidophila]
MNINVCQNTSPNLKKINLHPPAAGTSKERLLMPIQSSVIDGASTHSERRTTRTVKKCGADLPEKPKNDARTSSRPTSRRPRYRMLRRMQCQSGQGSGPLTQGWLLPKCPRLHIPVCLRDLAQDPCVPHDTPGEGLGAVALRLPRGPERPRQGHPSPKRRGQEEKSHGLHHDAQDRAHLLQHPVLHGRSCRSPHDQAKLFRARRHCSRLQRHGCGVCARLHLRAQHGGINCHERCSVVQCLEPAYNLPSEAQATYRVRRIG